LTYQLSVHEHGAEILLELGFESDEIIDLKFRGARRQPTRNRQEQYRMSLVDAFLYDGKRVLVVGGATGMGAAAAQLVQAAGAEVVVMDYAAVTQGGVTAIHVNLADRESIDAAIGACGGRFDALFSCAGVADGTPGIERVNFIGHRYLIDRLLEGDMLPPGSAIGMISSAAGLGWEPNIDQIQELLDTSDWDAAVEWTHRNGKADYLWMKRAMCAYVARQAYPLFKRGIRINAICPGPTDTPLAQANKEQWLGFGADYRADVGSEPSTPLEQAYPLVFLCSAAAAAINGQTVVSDQGYLASGLTGTFPAATPTAQFLFGKFG
jgi:NAD(P)-dependent dehydrogenase (short-subunit alcohol dehydrogenase family)